jgi:NADH dehydrogenase
VVIVGGGFGGLYAAKRLGKAPVEVTVIDKRNFHLFQPLLYQVATGGLSPGDIAAPIRTALRKQKNTEVLLAEVVDLDPQAREVVFKDGARLPYDTLIVAAGATHSYFGHSEWESVAPGLKTVEDATEIRRRILYAFEAAEREQSPEARREWLTFLIVGGGPTGVELAGAISEVANRSLREEFRRIRPEESQVLLLDAGDRLLSTYPEDLSRKAEQQLIALNVRTRTGVRVVGVDERGVSILVGGRQERLQARSVFWAAGVQSARLAGVLAARTGVVPDRMGRIPVAGDLSVPGFAEIFVIGDMAALVCDGKPVPGVAPAAMQMGRYVAERAVERAHGNARSSQEAFRYVDKGSLAVIGRASAVADFGFLHLTGIMAWLAWLFIHLMYIVGFQNRVLIFVQWAFHYFTFNRSARLIVGDGHSEFRPGRPPG